LCCGSAAPCVAVPLVALVPWFGRCSGPGHLRRGRRLLAGRSVRPMPWRSTRVLGRSGLGGVAPGSAVGHALTSATGPRVRRVAGLLPLPSAVPLVVLVGSSGPLTRSPPNLIDDVRLLVRDVVLRDIAWAIAWLIRSCFRAPPFELLFGSPSVSISSRAAANVWHSRCGKTEVEDGFAFAIPPPIAPSSDPVRGPFGPATSAPRRRWDVII